MRLNISSIVNQLGPLRYALLLQAGSFLALTMGDIGLVDSAGDFGLTWEGLLFFGAVYTVALFWGLWLAIGKRRDRFAIIQLIPVLGLLLWSLKPSPRFDPAKFQEWVGRPQEELIERLRKTSGMALGHDDAGEYVRVPGMTAYFSQTGTVLRIQRNDDR